MEKNIHYQTGSVVSREVLKTSSGSVTFFAFDAGQGLSEHRAPYDALLYIIDGEANIAISGKSKCLKKDQATKIPAGLPHTLKAEKRFKMLLVMLKK